MTLDNFIEASDEWVGELVRYHWGGGHIAPEVGLVVGIYTSSFDDPELYVRHKRLIVWWPELDQFGHCSCKQLVFLEGTVSNSSRPSFSILREKNL